MTFKGPLEVGKTYELNDGTAGECVHSKNGVLCINGRAYQKSGALIGGGMTGTKAVKRCIDDRPHSKEKPMKPKFYPGTDFQTADGRNVEIYKVTDEYIHGQIGGQWIARTWNKFGKCCSNSARDLIPAPRKVTLQECWIDYSPAGLVAGVHVDQDDAAEYKPNGGYIRHIPAEERDAND